MNKLMDAEADQLGNAAEYDRTAERRDTRLEPSEGQRGSGSNLNNTLYVLNNLDLIYLREKSSSRPKKKAKSIKLDS